MNGIDRYIKDLACFDFLIRSLDACPEPIVITDAQLDLPGPKIVYVNIAFCKQTGYATEEVIGRTPRMFQGKKTTENFRQSLKLALQSGQTFFGITTNHRKDGSEYVVQLFIAPVYKDNTIINYIAIQGHYDPS